MKYTYIIFILVLILSCNKKKPSIEQNNSAKLIDIKHFDNNLTANINDLYDSISIISLKTKSPIGSIKRIMFKHDNIYIWDKSSEKVWGFTNNGDSLFCIDKQGKGSDEYIRIEDVSISDSGHVQILDVARKSILSYDLKGKIKDIKTFNHWIHKFWNIDGYLYSFSATPPMPKGYYVDVMKGSKKINSYFPATHIWHFDGTEFFPSGDSLFFTRRYDDCIYYFKNGLMNEAYNINFGNDKSFMNNLREAATLKEHKKILKSRDYIGDIDNLLVTDTHITFDYSEPLDDWVVKSHFMFNRKTKKGLSFKSFGESNRECFLIGTPIASDGNYFYAIIEPWRLDASSKKKLQDRIDYPLNSNSNILLCRFVLKL